jgi:hypothetical protein
MSRFAIGKLYEGRFDGYKFLCIDRWLSKGYCEAVRLQMFTKDGRACMTAEGEYFTRSARAAAGFCKGVTETAGGVCRRSWSQNCKPNCNADGLCIENSFKGL